MGSLPFVRVVTIVGGREDPESGGVRKAAVFALRHRGRGGFCPPAEAVTHGGEQGGGRRLARVTPSSSVWLTLEL